MIDWVVFVVAGAACLAGALGVIVSRHPVHAALNLVMTLFAVAVLFVAQEAHFLAAVQVIVYAGAIVVLFLFVIMLLGIDRQEDIRTETLRGQRPLAFLVAALVLAEILLLARTTWVTGADSLVAAASGPGSNIAKLGELLFTRYLLAFEATSVLLVIAVVAAIMLARRAPEHPDDLTGDEGQVEGPGPSAEPVVAGAPGDAAVPG